MIHRRLLSLFLSVAVAAAGRAETIPSFHLDHSVAQSAAIVHGKLDATGQLEVKEILKGKLDPKRLVVQDAGDALDKSLHTNDPPTPSFVRGECPGRSLNLMPMRVRCATLGL